MTLLVFSLLQGYAEIIISPNDYWSGWVGFYAVNSSVVYADEDASSPAVLTIERRNSSFGTLEVRICELCEVRISEWLEENKTTPVSHLIKGPSH